MIPSPGKDPRTIRLLLGLYPAAFRARFGPGMTYALQQEYRDACAAGPWGRAAFWSRTVPSLFGHAVVEHLRRRRSGAIPSLPVRTTMWSQMPREFRHAIRRLGRNPGFAVTALLTLGLGIGATTAIYSIVHGVVLRPLPYPDSDRIVRVGHTVLSATPGTPSTLGIPSAGWFYYGDHSTTLAQLAVYTESSTAISGMGEPVELRMILATPSLLPVLGVVPAKGRNFTEDDTRRDAPPVVLVSHGYWVRHLGADPNVIGQPALPGGKDIVIGVLPSDFTFERPPATAVSGNPFTEPDLVYPLGGLDRSNAWFGNFRYQAVARLADGVTPEDAERELQALMPSAASDYPGGFTPAALQEIGVHPTVTRFKDAIIGDFTRVLWLLSAAVGFVLLIATANVANLFLVRAEVRRGEVTVRRALGASRGSLARNFLTESVLLAALGGVLGTALAWAGTRVLLRLAPTDLPRVEGVGMNIRVLGFVVFLSLLVGIAFGLVPSLQRDRSWGTALGRGGTVGQTGMRTRRILVIAQVAFAVVLLVSSGLLVRTFQNLHAVDPGFEGGQTATLRLPLSRALLRDAGHNEPAVDMRRSRFMLDVASRLLEVPGVTAATFSADLPLDGTEAYDFVAVEGQLPSGLESAIKTLRVFVGPGYFSAIGAHLRSGRELEAGEFADQPRSVVVNRAFAERWFPQGDALGRRIMQWAPSEDPSADVWYTIVGVVENIHEKSLMAPAEPTVYLPTIFLPASGFGMFVSNMVAIVRVRDGEDPGQVLPRVHDAIRSSYPEIPINSMVTLDEVTARSFQQVSFAMLIVLLAAAAALGLGLVGIYGTVSYLVGRRTREFGLRIALGASGWDLRRDVLLGGGVTGLIGIGLGLGAALVATRVVRAFLFGVSATDPLIYGGVALVLLALVLLASLGPAGQAAAADPMETMRAE